MIESFFNIVGYVFTAVPPVVVLYEIGKIFYNDWALHSMMKESIQMSQFCIESYSELKLVFRPASPILERANTVISDIQKGLATMEYFQEHSPNLNETRFIREYNRWLKLAVKDLNLFWDNFHICNSEHYEHLVNLLYRDQPHYVHYRKFQ